MICACAGVPPSCNKGVIVNYKEALAYLYGLSDFERGGSYTHPRNPLEKLPREQLLLERLGNPQQRYSCTLIAGTKGKGSTAAYIERVLRAAGVRTGLYTQPDLHTFRERMRVNGRLISEQEMAELVPEVRAQAEWIEQQHEFGPFITYEVSTALAFLYFARQGVQHAVLEVGLGGRLDATNITQPLVSVIASISYDHVQILGNTLREIATEKAGIIKEHGLVVTSAQSPEALLAIAGVSRARQARMVRIGPASDDPAGAAVAAGQLPALSYRYALEERAADHQRLTIYAPGRTYRGLEIPLAGQHQLENATLALAALELLREKGVSWDEAALREGLRSVYWPARIEVVGHDPTVVVDGAHNADSMQKLLETLHTSFTLHRLIVVLSVSRDKDLEGIARAMRDVDIVVLTRVANLRAAAIEDLEAIFAQYAPRVQLYSAAESSAAMDLALDLADRADLVCATGSLYLAGEALRWSAARGNQDVAATIEGVDH
jgi:dihydrofolate synthase / folylpolyglutamate synthase